MKIVKSPDSRGFTLIEVLIALSLLSVMMLMLFAGLRIAAKSWDKGENKLVQVTNMTSVHNFFHNQLAASLPLWDDFTNKRKQFSFQGNPTSLQFVASLPASSKRLGLQYFYIHLEKNTIKVAIRPFYPALETHQWKIEAVTLVNHVAGLTIRYFGNENKKELPTWQSRWNYEHLPKLVAIDIQTEEENDWPEIILRLNNQEAPEKALNIFEKALRRSNKNDENPTNQKNPFAKRRGIDFSFMGSNVTHYNGRKLHSRHA